MYTQLINVIVAVSLIAPTIVKAADSQVTPSVATPEETQSAIWVPRTLSKFTPPMDYVPANGYETNTHFLSCDELVDKVRFVLVQLGARPGDIAIDQRECRGRGALAKRFDVTFSVLVPLKTAGANVTAAPVEAQWTTTQIGGSDMGIGDCAFLRYITMKVLPVFSSRNIKLISPADCTKFSVGLRADILKMRSHNTPSAQ